MSANSLLLLNLAPALYMTGLIWFVQVVHYPLFAQVPAEAFTDYERGHQTRTSWVVAPVMLAELAASITILLYIPGQPSIWAASALTGFVWISTLLIQMPLHARLGNGYSLEAIGKLVASNWLRLIAWSARSLLLLYALSNQ